MMTAILLAWLLSPIAPAGDLGTTIRSPRDRQAAMLCIPALAARARGEVASISVSSARRSGSHLYLRGEMRVLRRPPPPRPGEMAPAHIINAHLAYQCWLSGSTVSRSLSPSPSNYDSFAWLGGFVAAQCLRRLATRRSEGGLT
jgi:hypothetical protein